MATEAAHHPLEGVLELLDKSGGQPFSPSDMETAGLFAAQAAIAIEQSRVAQNLSRLLRSSLAETGTRKDLVLQAMRDPDTFTVDDPRFSTAQVIGPSMLSLDGDAHSANRGPFARAFRLDAVRERFTDVVRVETDLLIDTFADDGHAELRRSVAGPLAVRVMIVALGLEDTPPQPVLGKSPSGDPQR